MEGMERCVLEVVEGLGGGKEGLGGGREVPEDSDSRNWTKSRERERDCGRKEEVIQCHDCTIANRIIITR